MVPLAAIFVVGCFEESGPVGPGIAGTATESSDDGTTATTATTAADSGSEASGTTGGPDAGSTLDTTAADTEGVAVWSCADQAPEAFACEAFEPADGTNNWATQTPVDVVSSMNTDQDEHGTFQNYVLSGGDSMRAVTTTTLEATLFASVQIEFDVRFHTAVPGCLMQRGNNGEEDLTVLSMFRTPVIPSAREQLIFDASADSAELWRTGEATGALAVIPLAESLGRWIHVELVVSLEGGTVELSIGGRSDSVEYDGWQGVFEEEVTISFGPVSAANGVTFDGCEYDLDNVVVRAQP